MSEFSIPDPDTPTVQSYFESVQGEVANLSASFIQGRLGEAPPVLSATPAPDIYEIDSGKPGPALAIFAGVHGNELAGVYALRKLLPTLKPAKGKLFVAFANPPAIMAEVRMLGKNLNRCFVKDNQGTSYEDARARELMQILDKCDALLDLHMFYDDSGKPFAICEDNGIELARLFDVDIISTNWSKTEPGAADGYMNEAGKLGICVECGPISQAKTYSGFAAQTVYQFLKYFDMTNEPVAFSHKPKRLIKAKKTIYRSSANFVLSPGFRNFDKLHAGQTIAIDGGKKYKASAQDYIIFPHYKAQIGEEAYIIGVEQTLNDG